MADIERSTRCYDRARLFLGGATYDNHLYRNNFSILRIDSAARSVARRAWELDPRKPKWEEKEPQEYTLRTEKPARGAANPKRYLAWLEDQTQFVNLYQLKVGPGDVPTPAIHSLYIHLKTDALGLKQQPVALEEALRNRRLVIEGKPGGGKTTFVRWIAWNLCRPGKTPPSFPVHGFPLLVRVSQLDQHIATMFKRAVAGDPAHEADPRWIAHFLGSQGWGLDEVFFREKLVAEDTVLLLDGLDEAANQARREKIVELIKTAATQYRCHFVVTTRPGAHEGRATLVGFEKASIDDLDDVGMEAFLLQWCRWLKRGDEAAAQRYYAELRRAVAVPPTRILARNPLMLTALAVLHLRRQRLPEQRAQLYEQILDWLADQAVEKHPDLKKNEILERFGTLALCMQEWKGGQKLQIGVDTAARILTERGQSIEPARRFLEQAQIDSGIITLRGGEIAFWHASFQEYLAARTLAGFPDDRLSERALEFVYSPEGREVLPLLAGHMAVSARESLDTLMDSLTTHAAAEETLERKAHAAGVIGNMLTDLTPTRYKLRGPAEKQYAQLRASVTAIFEKGRTQGIGLKTRVAAAEALDQASQARLRAPDDETYWVQIAGGTFSVGDPKAANSLPVAPVILPAFRIGRFPVTVWEYGRYLDDTGVAAPPEWEEQAPHPGRPVTRVTWDDAQRYCAWASGKWGIHCNLPTEQQWEFAARGTQGRIYPWGPEDQPPDEYRANFGRMVGEPTPVGMFPDGSTPEGVADMAGNVWEWTESDFDDKHKVARGASFSYDATGLRAAARLSNEPGIWFVDIGFRCVQSP